MEQVGTKEERMLDERCQNSRGSWRGCERMMRRVSVFCFSFFLFGKIRDGIIYRANIW